MERGFRIALCAGASAAALWTASPAAAQSAAPPLSRSAEIEEIIVTAQKREERLQDVALAITAVSGETLKAANVDTIFQLNKLAPSLYVAAGLQSAKVRVNVRGVGSSGGTSVEPSVAMFLDGIYTPREGSQTGAYLDVEAIEVLRGPQGTLFGRNASVGAISIRSVAPNLVGEAASLTAEYGTGDRYRVEGFANVPLGDQAALRVAAFGELFDGLYTNDLTGDRVGGLDSGAFRVSGLYEFTPELRTVARVFGSRRKGDGWPPAAFLAGSAPAGTLETIRARFGAIGGILDADPFDRHVNQYIDDRFNERQFGFSADTSWDVGSGFRLRLLNGASHWTSEQVGTGALPSTVLGVEQHISWKSRSQSHELQLISPEGMLDGNLSFVSGLYYLREEYRFQEALRFGPAVCALVSTAFPPALRGALLPSCNAGAADPRSRANHTMFDQTTESYAAYGQASYRIGQQLEIVLGARYTDDKKSPQIIQVLNSPIGALTSAAEQTAGEISDSRMTYRAGVNYHPTRDVMLYAAYATGFKSAGFNSTTSAVALGQRRFYDAETVESYEAGVRSTWLGGGLVLNGTVYRMTVDNFQDRSFNGLTFSVGNSGAIRNQGVEVEAAVRPTRRLKTNLALSYLDSVFTSYPGAPQLPGITGGARDLTGTRPTFAPKWQGNLGAEYDQPLGGDLELTWRANVAAVSRTNISQVNDNNPDTVQKGYSLLSARVTLHDVASTWALSAFGENLTGEKYCATTSYVALGTFLGAVTPGHSMRICLPAGAPRTFGFSATKRF